MTHVRNTLFAFFISFLGVGMFTYFFISDKTNGVRNKDLKKARAEYFHNKLKDPATDQIPENVRARELQFSHQLKENSAGARTEAGSFTHQWKELGPSNIGGRTRALAVDVRNSNVVLAAGVSGGIWKSTDGGDTWEPKLDPGSNLSIVSLAQDPNSSDTWYASMGEGTGGGSSNGKGGGNNYLGSGIYKSSNNGEDWEILTYDQITADRFEKASVPLPDIPGFLLGPFQLTSKLLVHNDNGNSVIYLTTQYFGIWSSIDGADSFDRFGKFLSNNEDPIYTDVIIDNMDVMTVWVGPTSSANNGFFRSYDLGQSFFEITPPSYPNIGDFSRTLLAFAPSRPTNVYSFTFDGVDDHLLYHFELDSFDNDTGPIEISNRSSALSDFVGDFGGELTTQDGYDMSLAVHPTDENVVLLGYTNLVRSDDGFQTDISADKLFSWVGGYDNPLNVFDETHHPDQHLAYFDPNDPDVVWTGHDGGISRTNDIMADPIQWESMNNGYNVTQFYTVALGRKKNNTEIVGGTQDNGTPIFDISAFQSEVLPSLGDVSSGDGSFCFVGDSINYTSAQEGAILVGKGNNRNFYVGYFERTDINTLFIHPFAVDPIFEGTLFYPDAQDGLILRNRNFIEALQTDDNALVDNNWEDINLDQARTITAIKVTEKAPSHRLYFGGLLNSVPYLAFLDSSFVKAGSDVVYQSLNLVDNGAYLVDIALNPEDGEEIILVYSSYNITGLFHSTDGGATITAIEGNLGINDESAASGFTGPSMRAAEIVLFEGEKKYVVATSIGLFATSTLDGNNTVWSLETDALDNVVIEDLDSRVSDGTVLVGTHGRGMFIGEVLGANTAPVATDVSFQLNENVSVGTIVGNVDASDEEGDQLSYNLTGGNPEQVFEIDSLGSIIVKDNLLLDFEGSGNFLLTVQINDGELTTEILVTITLQNVNEVPSVEDVTLEVAENSNNGTVVGTIVATDPEDDPLSFSIVSGNVEDAFTIGVNTGIISVNNVDALDFEQTESFTLLVSVGDSVLTAFADVTIAILDIDDALGIRESKALIFPNPVGDYLYFSFPEDRALPELAIITDLAGRTIRREKVLSVNNKWEMTGVRPGVYHLRFEFVSHTTSGKIVVSH